MEMCIRDRVKEFVKAEVLKDKKAEMLLAKLNGVKSVAEAKAKGANVTAVNPVSYTHLLVGVFVYDLPSWSGLDYEVAADGRIVRTG